MRDVAAHRGTDDALVDDSAEMMAPWIGEHEAKESAE